MTAEFVSLGDQRSVCRATLPNAIVGGDGAPVETRPFTDTIVDTAHSLRRLSAVNSS
ncbi:MAG: hypothetical protein JOZ23_15425 [Mycobacterium sp.]|nr:hypothetical protein [Mycobacterium sp.]